MEPLRWSWNVSMGQFLRGSVGAQRWSFALIPVATVVLAFFVARGESLVYRLVIGLGAAILVAAVLVSLIARQLRRRRRTTRGKVQGYALGTDALVLSVDRDSYTLPTSELSVAAHGRDWIALRRRGMGRRPLLLFFDDPGLVPQVEAVLREHGAAERS